MKIIVVLVLLGSLYFNYSLMEENDGQSRLIHRMMSENDNLQYQFNQCKILYIGR